jgi:hypothetical protein
MVGVQSWCPRDELKTGGQNKCHDSRPTSYSTSWPNSATMATCAIQRLSPCFAMLCLSYAFSLCFALLCLIGSLGWFVAFDRPWVDLPSNCFAGNTSGETSVYTPPFASVRLRHQLCGLPISLATTCGDRESKVICVMCLQSQFQPLQDLLRHVLVVHHVSIDLLELNAV